jgi:hypothetical protein
MLRNPKICYKSGTIHLKGDRRCIEDAQEGLCRDFPQLILLFCVKTQVINGRIICHIDWQAVLGNPVFLLAIKNQNQNEEDFKAEDN